MQDPTLAALARFPQDLRAHYAVIPETHAAFEPASWDGIPSERFGPLAQLWHVRDIELEGYHVRFRRTLQEDRPLLEDIDSYALAASRGVRGPAEQALGEFTRARADTIALLTAVSPADFARPPHFDGYGPTTLRGLVHFLCSHDQQHLAGLQWLAGQIDAARAFLRASPQPA